MKRRVHLEIITCAATEADPEGDSEIACGTQVEFGAEHLTNYPDHVTCSLGKESVLVAQSRCFKPRPFGQSVSRR